MRDTDEELNEAAEPGPSITSELFREWRSPRFGTSNPDRMNNPVWEWLIESKWSAYSASRHFGVESRECTNPGWSFARFGRSATALADGRQVLIGGEHEDFYDADFYIYNDVVVRHPDGRVDIFGYPRDVFPPTDFHSATLASGRIVVIGGLGYPRDRKPGATPVVVLDVSSFSASTIVTTGEMPGWIHRHSATLAGDGAAIVVSGGQTVVGDVYDQRFSDNGDDWRLDLATWRWDRLTNRRWRQWRISRADRRPNQLVHLRSAALFRGVRWAEAHRESMETVIGGQLERLREAYGIEPDLDLFSRLYTPGLPHDAIPDVEGEFGIHRIRVDGVTVRYGEEPFGIGVTVEGILSDATTAALVADLRDKLEILENTEYVASEC